MLDGSESVSNDTSGSESKVKCIVGDGRLSDNGSRKEIEAGMNMGVQGAISESCSKPPPELERRSEWCQDFRWASQELREKMRPRALSVGKDVGIENMTRYY